jgi:hypothetical protein
MEEHRAQAGKSRVFQTLPAKHIASKAEYTNTQQGLPGIGYTLAITRLMKAYKSSGFGFS